MDTKSLNVLIVEDNPVNIELMELIMKRLGHRITVVWNGQQAVNAVKNGMFDLIFMDIQMPVMDGLEATRQIRLHQASSNLRTPIIALTANTLDNEAEFCHINMLDGCITKPIRMEKMTQMIRRYVS